MGLEKAAITNLLTGERISVMFNPEEYSLDLGNTFAEIAIPGLRTPPIQYIRGNTRNLKMELFFDTTDRKKGEKDVRTETRKITSLLDKDAKTKAPPVLLFSWGGLNFKCVLESAGQRFTMFLEDGTPVRAKIPVSFKEYEEVDIEIKHGFFFGPPTVHNIIEGDTLSAIADKVLGDPGAWREIAEYNNVDNPRKLDPGKTLIMPPRKK